REGGRCRLTRLGSFAVRVITGKREGHGTSRCHSGRESSSYVCRRNLGDRTRARRRRGGARPEVAGGPRDRLRRIQLVTHVDVALMFLIVFDMVAKPFNWG